MARFTARLAREALAAGIPFIIENPQTSMLWSLPPFRRLLLDPRVATVDTHFCQFGKPWRKATKLMTGHCEPELVSSLSRKRSGKKVCSRTGAPHIQLSGTAPDGRFWTLVAQPYPTQLCEVMARALLGLEGHEHC